MTSKHENTDISNGFEGLGLPDNLLEAVQALGYTVPTPIQAQAIPPLLAGSDVLGQAQTGTGKTAAFALPLLANIQVKRREPQVLVLVPTRELALQVAEAFMGFAANMSGLNILPIYGGQGYSTQLSMLRKGAQIIIGTPGRVMDHMRRGALNLESLKTLILDEADEMLRMGFAEDVEWILEQCPAKRQTGLFSATLPAAIKSIAERFLDNPTKITVKSTTTTNASIKQYYWQVNSGSKIDALSRLIETEDSDAMIVFVRTKRATEELAEALVLRGFNAVAINGDIVQKQRERVIDQLKTGRIKILVATDVAARGIDVDKITHVINYDPPHNADSYVHRIGRTGRAGRTGKAIIFISPRDKYVIRDIERVTKQEIEPMVAPSVASVNERRLAAFKESITTALTKNISFYEDVLEQYIAETNTPAIKVAAALARMAQGGKELVLKKSDIIATAEVREGSRDRFKSRDRDGDSRSRTRSRSDDDAPRARRRSNDDAPPPRFKSRGDDDAAPRARRRSDDDAPPRFRSRGDDDAAPRARRRNDDDAAPRFRGRSDDSRPQRRSSEHDMEQYRVNIGADDGLQPKNLVGAIANTAGIEGRLIGKIKIEPKFALVDLPKGMPKDMLQVLKKLKISGKQMNIHKVV